MLLVKVGGGRVDKSVIAREVKAIGMEMVFVHGANVMRNVLSRELGQPTEYITSPSGVISTYTNQRALEILIMAYSLANVQWVAAFLRSGVRAVGLSGADGSMWIGNHKKYIVKVEAGKEILVTDTFTGKVTSVNHELLRLLIDQGYLPVITQPAITADGILINTDNDLNVAKMAAALQVTELVILFGAPGFLMNVTDPKSVVSRIAKGQIDELLPRAEGTMKKKLMGAKLAFELGVKRIYWGDARVKNPIQSALEGSGTVVE
jgi:acetylglutamate/LysW-gamma-L-alpha-aminoadipate kinase